MIPTFFLLGGGCTGPMALAIYSCRMPAQSLHSTMYLWGEGMGPNLKTEHRENSGPHLHCLRLRRPQSFRVLLSNVSDGCLDYLGRTGGV
ncbi:MAG: hypothetical protein CM1200mP18_19320 [Gammaproteobacteria bacterium]|nr:MAG: hypothetical protein CM1200mP18_19320 [Gammaproteobacteria bacterium]